MSIISSQILDEIIKGNVDTAKRLAEEALSVIALDEAYKMQFQMLGESVDEEMCEECGESPCECEDEELEEGSCGNETMKESEDEESDCECEDADECDCEDSEEDMDAEEELEEGAVRSTEGTVFVRHKSSGKELRITKSAVEKYKSLGYEVIKEEIDEEGGELLDEARRPFRIRVSASGKRRKKRVCGPGKKNEGNRCVPVKSKEKMKRKLAARKMKRTLSRKGKGFFNRKNIKAKRALRKRRGMGL